MISSISYDQHEIIQNIIDLHLDGKDIECDVTYGNGSFYKKGINRPKYCFDIDPKFDYVDEMNCIDIASYFRGFDSIMFDPPFLMTTGKGSIIKDRFGSYPTMQKLQSMYMKAMEGFRMALSPKGVLIVKMQNTVMSGKQWWNVDLINNEAQRGFKKIDEFVLLAKHRMGQHNLKKQRHARKYHCYFLVFRKDK